MKKKFRNLDEAERLSKKSAIKVIQGVDKLKSWGKTGWYRSRRLNRWYHYRSSIELNVLKALDESDYIEDFDTECFFIPYKWGAATLNYVPDVITKTAKGNVYVLEVKPVSQLNEDKNKAKWRAAKNWCWAQGAKFLVITENDFANLIEIIKKMDDKQIKEAKSLMEWKW